MFKLTKKKVAAGIVAAGIIAGTGIGYAYWSSSGTGTGSATTDTAANTLSITDGTTISDLAPGVAPGSVHGTIQNTQAVGGQNEYVHQVTASIASVTKASGAPAGTCDETDYTLSNPVMTVDEDLAPQASASFSGATLGFNNKATNQDACQGATVSLAYASN
jgi:hypothetical protein